MKSIFPESGFTLVELMVVVIVIGILTAVAIPTYINTREKAMDREAIAALRLVYTANKQYFSEAELFFPCCAGTYTVNDINGLLHLDLNNANWVYTMSPNATGNYVAWAVRAGGGRNWSVSSVQPDPLCQGTCL